MSDPTPSDNDFKNENGLVWSTLLLMVHRTFLGQSVKLYPSECHLKLSSSLTRTPSILILHERQSRTIWETSFDAWASSFPNAWSFPVVRFILIAFMISRNDDCLKNDSFIMTHGLEGLPLVYGEDITSFWFWIQDMKNNWCKIFDMDKRNNWKILF